MLKVIVILALVFAGIAIFAVVAWKAAGQRDPASLPTREKIPAPGADAWEAEEQRHGRL